MRLKQLRARGQSVWLDNISRSLVRSGELTSLIEQGVLGLTSNPTIFHKAVSSSADYDELIKKGAQERLSVDEILERLMVEDVYQATQALLNVYAESDAIDGYASLEVSPKLARDTAGTVEAGKRLWGSLGTPNAMIKVPATPEGLPAIKALLVAGINVNVTLIFSVERYREVMEVYLQALEERVSQGKSIQALASVASFFVSRLDALVEKEVAGKVAPAQLSEAQDLLFGKVALANGVVAYAAFEEVFGSDRFSKLADYGARVQRPLWASTGVKNPAYSPYLYVEGLIGPNTVTTLPSDTLKAVISGPEFVTGGLPGDLREAEATIANLAKFGIDFSALLNRLEEDGVAQFVGSFDGLIAEVTKKGGSL